MGQEIERKFLVRGDAWKKLGEGVPMRQEYSSHDPERVVRVRIEGDAARLTIKGRSVGAVRGEWEYPIPLADAEELLSKLCFRPLVEKTRYRVHDRQMCWEVDAFAGENAGLVVAEIELAAEDQEFAKPDWVGDEVTHDSRYYNSNLLRHPYCAW